MFHQSNRREFLFCGAGAAALARQGLRAAPRQPNIIVILADDLGFADLGLQGATDIPTPQLDRLAAGGVRFTNAYVSHPFCSPTRAGLMTGRYQQRFGHENNPFYDPNDQVAGLPTTEITLPQLMKQAGYATGIVGKWHLGAAPKFHPMKRGFDEMFGFIGGGHDYFAAQREGKAKEYLIPIERDGQPVEEREYLTDAFSREASAFVRRHHSHPFFLYLAYNSPHSPLQVTPNYLERVRHIEDETLRKYAAMIASVDDGVGRLIATLRELKLDSDTLVVFLSDNGGPTSSTHARNHPLRGEKGQVYEGGIRVPFLMWWPGRLKAGAVYHQPLISLDILPTAAALAGVKLPADRRIDGVNLLPHLLGRNPKPPHERLFWRWGGGANYAVREDRFKLVKQGDGPARLFDLEADAGEGRDLFDSKPELGKRLLAAYEEWNRELMPPIFQGPKAFRKST